MEVESMYFSNRTSLKSAHDIEFGVTKFDFVEVICSFLMTSQKSNFVNLDYKPQTTSKKSHYFSIFIQVI